MIRFASPSCQKKLKAPDHGAGRNTHCPRCGQRLWVPPPVRVGREQLDSVTGTKLAGSECCRARDYAC
jgi:hypothetical protein